MVKSWVLKKYDDANGKPLDVVDPAACKQLGYPMSLRLTNGELNDKLNGAIYVATPGGTADVYMASVDSNSGAVGAWTKLASSLPEPLVGPAAALFNGYVYVIGGLRPGTAERRRRGARPRPQGAPRARPSARRPAGAGVGRHPRPAGVPVGGTGGGVRVRAALGARGRDLPGRGAGSDRTGRWAVTLRPRRRSARGAER